MKKYFQKLENEYQDKCRIISLLNRFGKEVIIDYTPLEVNLNDVEIMNEIVEKELDYIKEVIEFNNGNKDIGIIICYSFKALFIGAKDFKMDNLNKRIEYFKIILTYSETKDYSKIKKLVNDLKKNIGTKEAKIINTFIRNYLGQFTYILLRMNNASTSILNEFTLRLIECFCVSDKNFEYNDLADIPHETFINDIYEAMIEKHMNNNIHIKIENKHIKVMLYNNDELLKYINDEPEEKNAENKKEEKDTSKKEEQKNNIEVKDNLSNHINEEKGEQVSTDKIVNDINKKFELMKMEMTQLRKEFSEYKEKSERKITKLYTQIDSLQKKNKENDIKITRISADLKLIKLRRAFKVFINYLYIGLGLKGDIAYEEKIKDIIELLKTFNTEKYDKKLVDSAIDFMNELAGKIDSGNYLAHHLDLDISVLNQIFEYIDKEQKYDDFKLKLKNEGNGDNILKKLIQNRENNFLNHEKLKREEKKINSTISDLRQLWIQKV